MSDDFFDDEQELMEAGEQASEDGGEDAGKQEAAAKSAGSSRVYAGKCRHGHAEKHAGVSSENGSNNSAVEEDAETAGSDAEDADAEAAKAGDADPAAAASGASAASAKPARQAPPFWMVLAIAAISLVLGVVIGYLVGTSATLAELSSASQTATSGTTSSGGDTSVELPEGHPQLSVDENGNATVADSGSSAGSASAATDSASTGSN